MSLPTVPQQPPTGTANINDLDLLNEVVSYDPSVTPEEFFSSKIPDDGNHKALIMLGDRGVKIERQRNKANPTVKDGPGYLNVHIVAQILDPITGEPSMSVYDNPTSIVFSAKSSKVHMVLVAVGSPAPAQCTLSQLKEHVEQTLAQPCYATITTQWEASVEVDKGQYETVLKGQKKFPEILDDHGNPTGRHEREVLHIKTGKTANAQAKIVRYDTIS